MCLAQCLTYGECIPIAVIIITLIYDAKTSSSRFPPVNGVEFSCQIVRNEDQQRIPFLVWDDLRNIEESLHSVPEIFVIDELFHLD